MTWVLAAIVDPAKLGQVVLYSFVVGVGISIALSLAVSGAAGLVDAVRERRMGSMVAWAMVTTVCVGVIAGAIVLGLVVMSSK
jgi:hypothetical protein